MVPGVGIHDSITLGEDTQEGSWVYKVAGQIRDGGLNKGSNFCFQNE